MRTCEVCGGHVPEVTRGVICPECLGQIIANSMVEDEDDEDFEPEDDLDPIPTEPEDDDIVTSDYLQFYRKGFEHKGPVVECREGERWAHAVMAYMDDDKFYPNVWFIGERGDVDLIDMFEALHREED